MERCAIGEERTRVSTRLCVYYNCTADYNFQANYKDCIVVANMLDICLLRTDQGGDPELVRESQRRRYADVGLVDKVIAYDEEWRQTRGALDLAKKDKNATQKKIESTTCRCRGGRTKGGDWRMGAAHPANGRDARRR